MRRALVLVLLSVPLLAAPAISGAGGGIGFSTPAVIDPTGGSGEPGIVVGPGDVLYVNALGVAGDSVYRSLDRGVTWAPFHNSDYAFGGADSDLALDESGGVYLAGQWSINSMCMSVSTSKLLGVGWYTVPAVCGTLGRVDRPWLEAFTPDGALLPNVFLAHHEPCCQGVHLVFRSADGGLTFQPAGTPTTSGGFPGNLVADRATDTLYYFYPSWGLGGGFAPAVSRSTDLGATWTERHVAGMQGASTGLHRVTGALDAEGNLYVVWAEDRGAGFQVMLATSQDGGDTWSAARRISQAGGTNIMPWVVAGAAGRIDVVWYSSPTRGDPNAMPTNPAPEWFVRMGQSLNALSATPTFEEVQVTPLAVHRNSLCTRGVACRDAGSNRNLLDFFEVAIDSEGYANIVWAQDVNKPLVSNRLGITVVNGFARQVSGPGLL